MKTKLIALVLIVVLTSCTSKSNGVSILSGQICGKSCWNNIIIGKTEKQEFLKIISSLPNVDQTSITVVDEPARNLFDGKIVFKYYRVMGDQDSLVNTSAQTNNQKIIFLTFQGNLGLTFQDVENEFGEPDLASSLWTFDGGINVRFINSLEGFEIINYFPSEKASVSPDTIINNLSLFDPNLYKKFLEANLLTGDYKSFILYPWAGYGKIEEHYWPPRKQ